MYKPDTAILMSIQPKWCELIANGIKTVEVRKTVPKLNTPFKVYMYCTQTVINGDIVLAKSEEIRTLFPNKQVVGINKGFAAKADLSIRGKVFGEFVCEKTTGFYPTTDLKQLNPIHFQMCEKSCVDMRELYAYANGKKLYGLHISDVVVYEKPLELDCFNNLKECPEGTQNGNCKGCWDCEIKRAPQSWCYAKEKSDIR